MLFGVGMGVVSVSWGGVASMVKVVKVISLEFLDGSVAITLQFEYSPSVRFERVI